MNYLKNVKHSLLVGVMTNNYSEICNSTGNEELASIQPILKFLYKIWWRVDACHFDKLPDTGPAFIVGNTSGYIPWPALMLIYNLMSDKQKSRTIYTLADLDHIQDEQIHSFLQSLNFIPWSYDNAKQLIEKGELIAIFPEDNSVIGKTITARNRLKRFDWTKFLPAIETKIPIYPLITLGVDEANLVLHNSAFLSKLLQVKAFPVSPFFPWLPFPFNLGTLPVQWKMKLLPAINYQSPTDREAGLDEAKKVALRTEGEIQAEINRLLRTSKSRLF